MANDNNIFYKPELKPDLRYDTAGELQYYAEPDITPENNAGEEPPDERAEKVERTVSYAQGLLDMTEIMPGSVSDILQETLKPVVESFDGIIPEDVFYDPLEPEPEEKPPDAVTEFVTDLTPDEAAMLADIAEDDVSINLEVTSHQPLWKLKASAYNSDLYDIREYFVDKQGVIMQAFTQEMILLKNEASLPKMDNLLEPYDGNSVTGVNSNMAHLHDEIVRSQIVRDQKARLFKKTHGTDETLLWMRQCKAAADQRTRYYKQTYLEEDEFLNLQSNSLLLQSRMQYDQRYQQAISGLYKYLNSAVIIVDDTLKMSLNEARAKAKLYSAGIDIFKTADVASITDGSVTISSSSAATDTVKKAAAQEAARAQQKAKDAVAAKDLEAVSNWKTVKTETQDNT